MTVNFKRYSPHAAAIILVAAAIVLSNLGADMALAQQLPVNPP